MSFSLTLVLGAVPVYWCCKSDYGWLLHEYTYQNCDYIIRTMNILPQILAHLN